MRPTDRWALSEQPDPADSDRSYVRLDTAPLDLTPQEARRLAAGLVIHAARIDENAIVMSPADLIKSALDDLLLREDADWVTQLIDDLAIAYKRLAGEEPWDQARPAPGRPAISQMRPLGPAHPAV
jgi:hypothetical protein